MLDVAFVKPALPRGGALVLPMAEEGGLGASRRIWMRWRAGR